MVRNGHLIPNLSSEYNGEHGVLIVYVTIDNGERLLPGTLAWPGSAGALLTRHCNKTSGLERQYLHVDVEVTSGTGNVKCTTSHCLETTYVIYNADIFVLKDIYIYILATKRHLPRRRHGVRVSNAVVTIRSIGNKRFKYQTSFVFFNVAVTSETRRDFLELVLISGAFA